MLIWPINLWAAKPVVDYHADVKDSEINLQVVTGKDIHSMCGVVVLIAQLCLTLCNPWTVACQAPLSMEFSRQEYWNGLPFPIPGDSPNPRIELASPVSPALAGEFFTTAPPGKHLLRTSINF